MGTMNHRPNVLEKYIKTSHLKQHFTINFRHYTVAFLLTMVSKSKALGFSRVEKSQAIFNANPC